jgi:trafficking protein particle complex subunit 9
LRLKFRFFLTFTGAPVPLVLENGTLIPPANLTDLPFCQHLQLKNIATHLRPFRVKIKQVDSGPFLFTPIHFNSQDRHRVTRKRDANRLTFHWVQNDMC